MQVKMSAAWARHLWHCTREHVETVCHGRCCECNGASEIPLFPDEVPGFVAAATATDVTGWTVETNPDGSGVMRYSLKGGGCPGKTPSGLCRWHGTPIKPWSCVASPFALSPSGETLIIRRRYALMACHARRDGEPAYKTFRPSLDLIFGPHEAARVCDRLDAGSGDVTAEMPDEHWHRLRHIGHVRTATPDAPAESILDLLGDD
jgi:hypothetical protein